LPTVPAPTTSVSLDMATLSPKAELASASEARRIFVSV